jgi:hypothetical protein
MKAQVVPEEIRIRFEVVENEEDMVGNTSSMDGTLNSSV